MPKYKNKIEKKMENPIHKQHTNTHY